MPSLGETPSPVQYESLPGAALYGKGYLLSWDNPYRNRVTLYGRDTKPVYSVA